MFASIPVGSLTLEVIRESDQAAPLVRIKAGRAVIAARELTPELAAAIARAVTERGRVPALAGAQ